MRERSASSAKPVSRRVTLAVDVAALSPRNDALAVLLVPAPAGARERWSLPWDGPREGERIEDAGARIACAFLGASPALVEQVGAASDGRRHPGGADVSIGVIALSPLGVDAPALGSGAAWFPLDAVPPLAPRHRALVDRAGFYRDVLITTLRAPVPIVHTDVAQQSEAAAGKWSAESTLRRLEAVLACRDAIDQNVKPDIAVEAMMLTLWRG